MPVVSSAGLVTWTNPATPPANWILQGCAPSGITPLALANQVVLAGTDTSFDAYGATWGGGQLVQIAGTDADGNLIYDFSVSSQLTKDQ